MITSRDNVHAKLLRSLLERKGRQREQCFLVEGVILVDDALQAGAVPRLVLYDAEALRAARRGRMLLDKLATMPQAQPCTGTVLQSVSDTVTTQGVVAAFPLPAETPALPPQGLAVVLDGVRDPGNVGTILRSAQAAGCCAVLATADTADLYSPKVVRAAMGAHFRLALIADATWNVMDRLLEGRQVYLAQAGQTTPYFAVDWTKPAALVIGNETEGPRPDAQRRATGRISIPMPGRAESLNAAVAASIIIFEYVRQTFRQPGH